MATLIASGGVERVTWQITGLSSPFNQSWYGAAGIARSPVSSGQSSDPDNVIDFTTAPESGSSYSTPTKSQYADVGEYTIYGWTQAANGLYYPAGSATITVTPSVTYPSFTTSVSGQSVTVNVTHGSQTSYNAFRIYIRESDGTESTIDDISTHTGDFTISFLWLKAGQDYVINVGYDTSTTGSWSNWCGQQTFTTASTGDISGRYTSPSSFTVEATNLQANPQKYYTIFVADITSSGAVNGYYCRYSAKPTGTTVSYTGSTSSAYSKYDRPIFLYYGSTHYSVGTKYSSLPSSGLVSAGTIVKYGGAGVFVYENGTWHPGAVFVYNNGVWNAGEVHLYQGEWK